MEEYVIEGGFDPFDLNGDADNGAPERCPECGSDQLYEVLEEPDFAQGIAEPGYACTRCGTVLDEWGQVIRRGQDYKLPENET